ncbi:MAG: hypothetical protein PHE51_08420, partial [Eubacteriales bacterium]|nr:hypothetical protein [Eubacteriales bacterium]
LAQFKSPCFQAVYACLFLIVIYENLLFLYAILFSSYIFIELLSTLLPCPSLKGRDLLYHIVCALSTPFFNFFEKVFELFLSNSN